MFTNVAYLHNSLADMVDTSRSLVVTSCGYYRVHAALLFPRTNSTDERLSASIHCKGQRLFLF